VVVSAGSAAKQTLDMPFSRRVRTMHDDEHMPASQHALKIERECSCEHEPRAGRFAAMYEAEANDEKKKVSHANHVSKTSRIGNQHFSTCP